MPSPPICPNCGARQRRPNARFCQNCGYPLNSTPAAGDSAAARASHSKIWLWIGGASLAVLILLGLLLFGPGRKLLPCCQPPQKQPVAIATRTSTPILELMEAAESVSPAPLSLTATPILTNIPAPHPTATPAPPPTATPTPSSAKTPSPTPTAINVPSPIPEVSTIEQRLAYQNGELIVHKDIHFSDPDGDAYLVAYQVIQSDIQHYHVEDDAITVSPDLQKQGAIVTATWRCGSKSYRITLRASILDRAGHQSEPFDLIFDCHP